MRGSDLMAWLRRSGGATADAVLLSCTATGDSEKEVERIRVAGADAVWSKPFPDFVDGSLQRGLLELLRARGKA